VSVRPILSEDVWPAAWRVTALACALNVAGVTLQLFSAPAPMPEWPFILSATVGMVLLAVSLAARKRAPAWLASIIFVLNNSAIVVALWLTHPYYATHAQRWMPFQANKLGAMTVALLAPELWAGLVSIVSLAGAAVIQFSLFPEGMRTAIDHSEPMATFAFGGFAIVLLGHRLYRIKVERNMAQRAADASVLERLGRASLAIRDLANTPLQTIRLSAAVLSARSPELGELIARIERAADQLSALGEALADGPLTLERTYHDLSFDALDVLRKQSDRDDDRRVDALVRIEQSRDVYSKGPVALATNVVNGLIVVGGLWGMVPAALTLPWMAALWLVIAIRTVHWRSHRRVTADHYDADRWLRAWTIGTGLTGALWGLAGVILFPPHSLIGQALLLFVVGGMVAGASASMASYVPGFLAFALPTLVLPIGRLLGQADRIHWAMALLLAMFGAGMSLIARMATSQMVENVGLRLRNGLLLEDLLSARSGLRRAERDLDDRVSARTAELSHSLSERGRFVATVARELGSPLAALSLNQQMIERLVTAGRGVPDDLGKLVALSRRQIGRIYGLIDDLLDMNRLA
jgi:hypothetical protein